jgi:hypothetical protein
MGEWIKENNDNHSPCARTAKFTFKWKIITMEEQFCSLCGKQLLDQNSAYGLTDGIIDQACEGFSIDFNSEWTLFCPECMNEIDRLIADFLRKKRRS